MILSLCNTEHGKVLSPRFFERGNGGELRLRSEFADSRESGALIAFGAELRDRADEIAQYGHLYFSAFEDPMSDTCCSLYGEAFIACQSVGIPVIFYTNEMEWADGYGLYARFLGIRKDLVSFGCPMGADLTLGSSYADRLKGLKSLKFYKFHTWCSYHISTEFMEDLNLFGELAETCSTIYLSMTELALVHLSSEDSAIKEFSDFMDDVMELEGATGVRFCLSPDAREGLGRLCQDVVDRHFPNQVPLPFTTYGERVEAYDVAEVIEEVMDSTREEAIRLHKEKSGSKL